MSRHRTNVYAWITGQDYNIGDSLLRRPYVETLQEIGELELWVRTATPKFLSNLGVRQASCEANFVKWYFRAFLGALRGRAVIALNAGEIWVSWPRGIMLVLLAVLATVARLRGGVAVWVGASFRPIGSPALKILYRICARAMTIARWREAESKRIILDRPVCPDWAFLAGSPSRSWTPDGRTRVAIVMRGDRREPCESWFAWLAASIAATGLEPVFVVQVAKDRDRAEQFATRFGGSVLEWSPADDHLAQEAKVRQLYRTCRLVVGDRLHGLIIAATEGAVPIGWVDSSSGKIARHFDVAGMFFVGAHEGSNFDHAPVVTHEMLSRYESSLPDQVNQARGALRAVQDTLSAISTSHR